MAPDNGTDRRSTDTASEPPGSGPLNVGLTGGIGSGKSAVSSALADLGAIIIDADKIAREVVEPGTPGLAAVIDAFGERLLTDEGTLDRPALAQIVFTDQDALRMLNGIVHPLVHARREELLASTGPGDIVVNDIPLLAEGSGAPSFHLVVVVHAPLETRLERLVRHRGVPEHDALARIRAQATDEERAAIADILLDNGGSLEGLHAQVAEAWEERLRPFAVNIAAGRPADPRPPVVHADRPRIAARLQRSTGRAPEPVSGPHEIIRLELPEPGGSHEPLRESGWFEVGRDESGHVLHSADPGCGHVLVLGRNAGR